MKKRFLSLLMVLCLAATMVPGAFAADGLHQVGDFYQIEDAADLRAFAKLVNSGTTTASAVLTADIDLGGGDFTPIGSDYRKAYSGSFDGKGHVIKNATITNQSGAIRLGVFGCVSGKVQDIVFDHIHVTNSSSASGSDDREQASSGVAAGVLRGGGTLSKITVNATCSVSGIYRTGGVVGSTRDKKTTIIDCKNAATVTGSGNYTGGITGAAHNIWSSPSTFGTTITNCINTGIVRGSSEVGGIAGYVDRAVISGCQNTGAVTGTGNYGTGGIVGCDIYNSAAFVKPQMGSSISNCENTGNIVAPRAGGILGSYVVAPGDKHPSSDRYSTISACTNTGAISSPTGTGKCGAIYGAPITYAAGDGVDAVAHMMVNIQNCFVGGSVEGVAITAENYGTLISPSENVKASGNVVYGGSVE